MWWLWIIIVSYFILSISNLVDKIFLSNLVNQSVVYALWVTILSIGGVVLFAIFWFLSPEFSSKFLGFGDLTLMNPWFIFVAVLNGLLFTLAIYLLYSALQKGEASRVIPLVGGSMPVMIYLMTFYYDPLGPYKLTSFVFLVIATILMSLMPHSHDIVKKRLGNLLALASAFSFSAYFVVSQYIFRNHGFINGIVWPRLGSIFALVWLLSFPHIRKLMRESLKPLTFKMKTIWISSQALGAIGFLGQQYTISIPGVSAALVSALQSIQYVFILLIASVLSIKQPKLLREYVSAHVIIQKALALICIALGFYFISI